MDETGTHALTASAIRGDPEAIRLLWQQHRRWVAAVLLAHKPREADLDDLLQEVAMTFVARIGTLRDERSIRPWLRTVALNAARAEGRKTTRRQLRTRSPLHEHAIASTSADEPGRTLCEHEEAHRVLDLALQLPEGYREPLLLRCLHGMSYRQISATLDLPETTIETRIARGRRMLRDLLKAREAVPEVPSTAEVKT